MNDYQKELNQIHMRKKLKEEIQLSVKEQKKSKFYVRCPKAILSISVGICILFSIVYTMNESKNYRTVPNEQYTPQQYSITNENNYTTQERIKEEYLYNEGINNVEELPVYIKNYSDVTAVSSEQIKTQQKKAEKIRKELNTQIHEEYKLENYTIDTNGDILFEIEMNPLENINESIDNIAQDLLNLPIFNNLNIEKKCETLEGQTCKLFFMEKDLNDEQTLSERLNAPYITYRDLRYYFILPYQDKLKLIKEYPIMTAEEAKKVLYQGGYYTADFIDSLKDSEIEHVEIVYGGADDNNKLYEPYVLPIYKYYLRQEDKVVCAEVPALYPEDLKGLEKNTWYFK